MQFLEENGFRGSREALEKESGLKYDKARAEGAKAGFLLSALMLQKEYNSPKNPNKDKDAKLRAMEDDILNPKGGTLKPVKNGYSMKDLHETNVITARFCPIEGMQHIVGSTDVRGKIVFLNSEKREVLGMIPPGLFKAPILTMDLHPKYLMMAVGLMNGSHHIIRYQLPKSNDSKKECEAKICSSFEKHGKYVNRVRWGHDGNMLATCSYDKEVRIYTCNDAKTAKESDWDAKGRFTFRRGVECVEWGAGASSNMLYVSLQGDNYIHTIDIKAMKRGPKYNMNSFGDDHVSFSALDLHSSRNGEYLIASTDKDRCIMFKSNSEIQARNFYGAESGQYFNPRAVFDPNLTNAYATSVDNTVVGWDIGSQRIITRLKGHTKMIRNLHVHPAKNMLVTGGYDKTVRIWIP